MPRDQDEKVSLPLLDRLTDLDPKLRVDAPLSRAQSVRLLKASLRRDLEWLFNSRANHECPAAGEMPEVFRSVYNYGLPDYSHLSLNNFSDRSRLQKQLEQAITMFEPRLTGITVRLVDNSYDPGRALRFQIDGLLKMDPAPEHVSFDTVLDIPSGEYQVKGDASAG
ncbi:MAG TPA: type VI secretion system baseplate subunit TssE [Bryobacteraceae bacterium]|nr:type VI secretion system baseplate subunit TssE [Bryobacteraceae bacterium]